MWFMWCSDIQCFAVEDLCCAIKVHKPDSSNVIIQVASLMCWNRLIIIISKLNKSLVTNSASRFITLNHPSTAPGWEVQPKQRRFMLQAHDLHYYCWYTIIYLCVPEMRADWFELWWQQRIEDKSVLGCPFLPLILLLGSFWIESSFGCPAIASTNFSGTQSDQNRRSCSIFCASL